MPVRRLTLALRFITAAKSRLACIAIAAPPMVAAPGATSGHLGRVGTTLSPIASVELHARTTWRYSRTAPQPFNLDGQVSNVDDGWG